MFKPKDFTKSFTKALVVLPLFIGSAVLCWNPALKAGQAENLVCFHWAFGAKVGPETARKYISVQRDTTMKSGDRFKMFVELQKACFVYLIYHGSQDSLHMLFPTDFRQYDPRRNLFQKIYMPGGDQWFVLDQNVGLETFYLLASAKRLKRLESFFAQYESAAPALKTELSQNILSVVSG